MSKYKFSVQTFSYDGSGYYLSESDGFIVTVIAESAVEAKDKAIKLREGDSMRGTHNKWGARILSADEVPHDS